MVRTIRHSSCIKLHRHPATCSTDKSAALLPFPRRRRRRAVSNDRRKRPVSRKGTSSPRIELRSNPGPRPEHRRSLHRPMESERERERENDALRALDRRTNDGCHALSRSLSIAKRDAMRYSDTAISTAPLVDILPRSRNTRAKRYRTAQPAFASCDHLPNTGAVFTSHEAAEGARRRRAERLRGRKRRTYR